MDEYIRCLRDYVREHRIQFEEECPQSCLDALWWYYGEYHALDSPQRKVLKKLRDFLESLPIKNSGAVIGEVGYLGAEYERIAFTTGLKLGAQLMVELTENVTRE